MPTYDVLGGGRLTAATDLELVEALRAESQNWVPSVSIEDFMEGMAQRCALQTGDSVRTDSAAHFVADLVAGGFLTRRG